MSNLFLNSVHPGVKWLIKFLNSRFVTTVQILNKEKMLITKCLKILFQLYHIKSGFNIHKIEEQNVITLSLRKKVPK